MFIIGFYGELHPLAQDQLNEQSMGKFLDCNQILGHVTDKNYMAIIYSF